MDAAALLAELTEQLHARAREKPDQLWIRHYLGTPRHVLGVRTDDLRSLARRTVQARDNLPDDGWLALLDLLYRGDFYEQRALAGILLGTLHPLRRKLELAHLRGWLAEQSGWAEVDTTCQSSWTDKEVLARWTEWDAFLDGLSQADVIALRRASLVLMVTPLRRSADESLTQRALTTVERLQHERDAMITKAVSWVLRTMAVAQPDTVRAYLAAHGGALPAATVREVRTKMETGRKRVVGC